MRGGGSGSVGGGWVGERDDPLVKGREGSRVVPRGWRSGRALGGCGEQRASREDRGVWVVTGDGMLDLCLVCLLVGFERERWRGLGF